MVISKWGNQWIIKEERQTLENICQLLKSLQISVNLVPILFRLPTNHKAALPLLSSFLFSCQG